MFAAMFLDRAMNPKCKECDSLDINQTFNKVFKCLVCKKCEQENPDKYSLLTKTEVREVIMIEGLASCREPALTLHPAGLSAY